LADQPLTGLWLTAFRQVLCGLSEDLPHVHEGETDLSMMRLARTFTKAALLAAVSCLLLAAAAASQPPSGFPSFGQPPAGGGDEFGDSRDAVNLTIAPSATKAAPGGDLVIVIVMDHQPGWHSWTNAGNTPKGMAEFSGAINTTINVKAPDGSPLTVHSGYLQWPEVHASKSDQGEGVKDYATFTGRAIAYIPVTIKPDAALGKISLDVTVDFQTCDDKTCKNPATVSEEVVIEIVGVASLASSPGTKASESDMAGFDATVWSKIHTGVAAPEIVKFGAFGLDFEVNAAGPIGLLLLCLVAAFGGALLNATPCVLPVIPIKIMSLSQHSGHRGRTLMLGFAMFLGVIAFWVALGGVLAGVSGFKATNQLFQYPAFTITVGIIIAIMAVGMAGFFTVRLPQAVYMINPRQDSLHGSFLFGVMTAVLSTPCTAPFMGAAAAWALKQTSVVVLTVFLAIGLGMGLPYFILSAFPKLVDRMPRTGPASEVIKQVMGLFMLAAAAYFVGVGLSGALVAPPDPPSRMYLWVVAAFVVAAGLWLIWRTFGITPSTVRRSVFGALGAAVVVLAFGGVARLSDKGPIDWTYYTPQRLADARSAGKVVVLEFTAEWCLNCKALEEAVLRNQRVASLLNDKDIEPIKVDLTGNNVDGNAMLSSLQWAGIPLLVILAPDGREIFKSDAYTIDQVVSAIAEARGDGIDTP